jgi:hypothetical protein
LLAATLALALPLGLTARPPTEPEGTAASATHTPRDGAARSLSGSVSARYRGLTAAQWAGRFKHRTRQLQNVRQVLHSNLHTRAGATVVERAFLCIHRYEGAWDDPNPPYWGGLQMDLAFQRAYGGEFLDTFGTADRWPPALQVATAVRAWTTRGFGPWPNTARACGLR